MTNLKMCVEHVRSEAARRAVWADGVGLKRCGSCSSSFAVFPILRRPERLRENIELKTVGHQEGDSAQKHRELVNTIGLNAVRRWRDERPCGGSAGRGLKQMQGRMESKYQKGVYGQTRKVMNS